MTEPEHDLRDRAGRARRLVLGIAIAIAASVLVYLAANALIPPERDRFHVSHRQMGRDTFVAWVSLLAGALSLFVSLVVQNRLAKTKAERERLPRASIR